MFNFSETHSSCVGLPCSFPSINPTSIPSTFQFFFHDHLPQPASPVGFSRDCRAEGISGREQSDGLFSCCPNMGATEFVLGPRLREILA